MKTAKNSTLCFMCDTTFSCVYNILHKVKRTNLNETIFLNFIYLYKQLEFEARHKHIFV